jgi:hypothetical protein
MLFGRLNGIPVEPKSPMSGWQHCRHDSVCLLQFGHHAALHLGANPQSTPYQPAPFAHFRINYFVLPSAADDAKTT